MAKQKFRKIIPGNCITSLEKYLEKVSGFINYVDMIVTYREIEPEVKKVLAEYVEELRSFNE